MKLIIDHREPEEVKTALLAIPTCEVSIEALDCGDFVVGPGAVVERKRGDDFVSSIFDGRLMEQAARLKATYARVFIVIEGNPYEGRSQIAPSAITGAISYLAALCQFTVLRVENLAETAAVVTTIARHLQDGLGYAVNLRPGKPSDLKLAAAFLVNGLPGIGGTRTHDLLAKFGSAQKVFTATAAELATVKGIGPRSAAAIREVLDQPFAL